MIPLAVHSHYSLMRGVTDIKKLCRTAARIGYNQLALTDTDNLYGLIPFLKACREYTIRPIIGAELTQPDNRERAFCLAENKTGYSNLCRLLTARHCEPEFNLQSELLKHHNGLCILTDSAHLLQYWHEAGIRVSAALVSKPDKNSYQIHHFAKTLGLLSVAVPDSYFLSADEHKDHLLLRAIDNNTTLCRLKTSETVSSSHWLPSSREFAKRFSIWPDAIRNSLDLAARCNFSELDFGLVLPPYKNRTREQADKELRHKALTGALGRYGDKLPLTVSARLDHELKIIAEMGFSSYFLVVHDIVRPVQRTCGRGSGAASLVAYCLHITNVCPIKHNLYFERFLNPGRKDAPDIDIDFAWDERDRILHDVLIKHKHHAAMVCNHVFFQPRSAIREVAKVFGLPDGETGTICKRLPWFRQNNDHDELLPRVKNMPELQGVEFNEPWPEIFRLAQNLIGTPRCLSVHPGGIVITPLPINDYVPIQKTAKGVPVIQWEKDGAEEAGLVKIDLLGNRSLGVIRDSVRQILDNGVLFDEEIWEPEDDPQTQNNVANGLTMGCFYIESPAMRLLQKKAGTGDFEHLVIHSSIIRPAANEFIREYIRRLHGGSWQPLHKILTGVLDDTFGIMVYQEDVSRVAVKFGFSHTDADRLRKIMSKKDKHQKLADYRKQFFKSAANLGVEDTTTEKIWRMMMSFDGYSFCKPHSASYAKVSFQAAYLKTHFPAEFMAAVISNQGGYYSTFAYVSEARRMGITILGPDVNTSTIPWYGKKFTIRTGLMAIKHLRQKTMSAIVQQRTGQPFISIHDFLNRIQPNEEEARAMIHAGALDSLLQPSQQDSKTAVTLAERTLLLYSLALWKKQVQLPYNNFALFPDRKTLPNLPPENQLERLRNEYRILGFLCSQHPITLFNTQRNTYRTISAIDIPKQIGHRIRFLGWCIAGKIVGAKNGDPMEFLTFEDETGQVECTFFPEIYKRCCHLLHHGGPLLLEGIVEEDFGATTLTVENAKKVKNEK